jgi:hypothetical protein
MRRSLYCPLCERDVVQEVPKGYKMDALICRGCRKEPALVRFYRTVRAVEAAKAARRAALDDNLYDVLVSFKEQP